LLWFRADKDILSFSDKRMLALRPDFCTIQLREAYKDEPWTLVHCSPVVQFDAGNQRYSGIVNAHNLKSFGISVLEATLTMLILDGLWSRYRYLCQYWRFF
jgi:hypothetical protein